MVDRSEAGTYICVASNTYWNGQRGENETYITVDVQYLDNVTIEYENGGKVIEGEVYTTQCLSRSNPEADFKWYDSDGVLVGTEATLTLDGVHRDDSGPLTCVGNVAFWDGSSEISNSTMTLDVQYISDAVISDNSDGKVIDGQRYHANCSVDANPTGSMYWITQNGTVIDGEQLVIEAAERTDAGNYTCGANVTFWDGTEKHAQSVIHIDNSPNVTITDSTDGKAIEEGSYQAICHAQGNPDPDILWYDDDEDMVMAGPDLVIDDISKENSGEYTCQANNTFWNGDQGTANETIFVDVQYISVPVVYSANDGLVIEGQPYYANCTVESNPSGIVFWLTPNLNVSEGANVEIEETDRTDNGNYTCMGETTYWDGSVGRRDRTTYVDVQYVPDVDNGHVVCKEGEDTVLPCDVDANPEPHSYTWQREGVTISEGQTLIIDKCNRTDAANYTCTAVNGFYDGSVGIGEGTVGLVVEYLPLVNLTVLPQTTLMEGESVIFHCQYFDGLPTPYKLTLTFGPDDDVLVEEEDGSALEYNISAVDRSQSGTYECHTTTLFYDSSEGHSSDNLELIVVYSATIVPEDIRIFEAEIGDTVTMDCTADGIPTPEITWYDEESHPILDGEENRKISTVIEGDRIISSLAVTVVSDFYYGEYTCKASNGISSDDTQHFQIVSLETGALNTDAIIIVTVTLGVLLLVAVTVSVVLLVRRRKNGSATLNGGSELSIM
ncbi:immunoglobulin superfamily member 10-like [Ptychodera flava]|uniref:immunoglobulin superfamily member 10-like n=1 Tax=Ptychodera flava TaxID=63121 RepID=UPI003969BC0F